MGVFLKKKSFFLLLLGVIFVIGVTGYIVFGRNTNKAVNGNILKTVKEIEISTNQLNTLQISYDEFKNRTDKYTTNYFTSFYKLGNIIYAENKLVTFITGKEYVEKDWDGMSLDEIKKIGETLRKSLITTDIGYNCKKIFISKAYEDDALQLKHIFVKHIAQFNNQEIPFYEQYTFKKEGNLCKLFSTRPIILRDGQELKYGAEKIEYVENVDFEM